MSDNPVLAWFVGAVSFVVGILMALGAIVVVEGWIHERGRR